MEMFEPFYFDTLEYSNNSVKELLPENLFHYSTGCNTLNILPTRTSDTIEFWATDSQYLNDSSEYVGGLDLIKECLAEHYSSDLDFIKNVHKSIDTINGQICVVSFSESGNNLNQYRLYSENGGYCLQFDPNHLGGPAHLAYRFLAKCIYSKEIFIQRFMTQSFGICINTIRP